MHPYYSAENPPYTKAQIMHADFLYFRDPDSLDGDIPKLLKLSLIALSFGYFDHALMILEGPEVAEFLSAEFGNAPIDIVSPLAPVPPMRKVSRISTRARNSPNPAYARRKNRQIGNLLSRELISYFRFT